MARYIDADNIKFTGFTFEDADKNVYIEMSVVQQAIRNTPTADVKEVVHAKWIWKELCGEVGYMLCCSNCLETEGARENAKFCSNCGAKMDGSKELTKLKHSSLCGTETYFIKGDS